ncbi:MAG: GumC family protein [Vogesella sp.]|uniref:GumC family protein n=1 Tax=Vogesella sp. TaxID=1904252 RepID=UPI00391AFEE0
MSLFGEQTKPAVPAAKPALLLNDGEQQQSSPLLEYWRIVNAKKWGILALGVAVAAVALVTTQAMRPTYRATAEVLIEANKAKVLSIDEVYGGVGSNREYFQTQAEIMKSREVALRAIKKLKLWEHPDYNPRLEKPPVHQPLLDMLGMERKPQPQWNEDLLAAAVYQQIALGKDLNIQLVRLSQLVNVSFDSTDAKVAADFANAVGEAYIENDREARFKMTQQASDWLQNRTKALRESLEASERKLQDYRERMGVIRVDSTNQFGTAKLIEEVTQRLVEARMRRAEAENAYNQIKNSKIQNLNSIPAVIRNPLLLDAQRQLADAERKHADVSQRYGPEHPRMVQSQAELSAAQENLKRQVTAITSSVTNDYEVARATERSLEATLGQARGGAQADNRKNFELAVLEREVASNRQLYDMFVTRAKETAASQDLQSSIGRVVDYAEVPELPEAPKKAQITLMAFVLALLLGAATALLRARLDNTLKLAGDVENKVKQPLLSTFPMLDKKQRQQAATLSQQDPHTPFAEAVRTAKTGVLLSDIDQERRVLVVTSSLAGEGKTTTSCNLALSLSQNKRTLLIDADMRRPSVAASLGLDPHAAGLSDLIAGTKQLADVLQQLPGSQVDLISAGTLPPNPLDLLLSRRFDELLATLKQQYDMIIIDSAPCEMVSDAVALAPKATGMIYVVRAGETAAPLVVKGTRRLQRAGGHLLGIVLNGVDLKQAERYGDYGTYGQYYGNYGAPAKK